MKHIGILAHSFEGATLCFRTACLEGVREARAAYAPEITMTVLAHGACPRCWERGDNRGASRLLHEGCGEAGGGGADFFVFPTIPPTSRWKSPGEPFRSRIAHREVVAEQAAHDGGRRSAILGTKYTMNGPVYPGALGRRGIGWAVPSPKTRRSSNDVIFDELCLGTFHRRIPRRLRPHHRKAEAGRLRRGRVGLHGNPVADYAGRLALADAGFDASAGEGGSRSCDRRAADAGLARRADCPRPGSRAGIH